MSDECEARRSEAADDLIRRVDAVNAIKPIYGWSIAAGEELEAAIAALPAIRGEKK